VVISHKKEPIAANKAPIGSTWSFNGIFGRVSQRITFGSLPESTSLTINDAQTHISVEVMIEVVSL
jgi:hypothetical protein